MNVPAGVETPVVRRRKRGRVDGYLTGLRKQGEHGEAFDYKTINTEVLGWILKRVTGQSIADLVSARLWSPMGAEADDYFLIDGASSILAPSWPFLVRKWKRIKIEHTHRLRQRRSHAKDDDPKRFRKHPNTWRTRIHVSAKNLDLDESK